MNLNQNLQQLQIVCEILEESPELKAEAQELKHQVWHAVELVNDRSISEADEILHIVGQRINALLEFSYD